MSLEMANVTAEKATRLDELWAEYMEAGELFDNDEGYVDYDSYEKVDKNRGVIKDICQPCLLGANEDTDLLLGISNVAGYEVHENMEGATCALCGEDFWGVGEGSLVLFEPKFSLKRWG